MKQKGALFILYAEIASVYTAIASCRSTSLTVNSETVDITDKSILWRELLENAGITSVSVKTQGITTDQASYLFIKDTVITGVSVNCKLQSNTGEVYSGAFLFTSFESSGEYNKEELFALTLESSGTTTLVDNSFRLLEDGSGRLLEDGSYRLLEAA